MNLKKKIIAFSLIFLLIVFIGLFLKDLFFPPAKIIKVYPSQNAQEINLAPEIIVSFDKEISPDEFTLSSIPVFQMELRTKEKAKDIKYVATQSLDKKTSYQMIVKFKSGEEFSWTFKTTESEVGSTPGWSEGFQKQKAEYEAQYPLEEIEIYNNIISKTPYFSQNYWVEHSLRSSTFTVHLCQEPFQTTQKEAENWFNSLGFSKLTKVKPEIEWLYGCEPPKNVPKSLPQS